MEERLIIVEFKEEAEFLHRQRALLTEGTVVLALLPEGSASLNAYHIPYENTLSYFSRRSHEEALRAVDRIIQQMNQVLFVEDDEGVSQTYLNLFTFYARIYLGYLIFNIEVIKNFMESHPLHKVGVFRYKKIQGGQLEISPQERITANIVRLITKESDVEVAEFLLKQNIPLIKIQDYVKGLYSMFFHVMAMTRMPRDSKPPLLFYSLSFNFDKMLSAFPDYTIYSLVTGKRNWFQWTTQKGNIPIYNLKLDCFWLRHDAKLNKTLTAMLRTLKNLHTQENLFVYRGVDFSSLFLQKVQEDFVAVFKVLNREIKSLKKVLQRVKPSVVVSPMARGLSFALGELAHLLNIPSVLISHGSHVSPKDEFDRMEWIDHGKGLIDTDYQYHLLQSPWAVEYAEAMLLKKGYYKVLPVVFTKVDRNDKEEKQLKMYPLSAGKKIIVHASTPKPRGSNRFYIYETLDEYIENINDLIKNTENMKDVFLVIRFRPSLYLKTEDLKRLLPVFDHYMIATEGNFSDYLQIADLMVSFSSTTIEEALLNKIPVLQYDRTGRYQHIKGAVWLGEQFSSKDSVYYIGQVDFLEKGIRWIIENHLNFAMDEKLFDRHYFDPEATITAAEFIRRLGTDPKKPINQDVERVFVNTQRG